MVKESTHETNKNDNFFYVTMDNSVREALSTVAVSGCCAVLDGFTTSESRYRGCTAQCPAVHSSSVMLHFLRYCFVFVDGVVIKYISN